MIALGGKLYDACPNCGKLVQLNKWMIGSFHICTTEAERIAYSDEIAKRYVRTKNALVDLRVK